MNFYFEERLAGFVIIGASVTASLLLGYARSPQIFLSSPQRGERDAVGVTVAGAVEKPGTYRVPKGSVARDAAMLAGPREDAALGYLDSPVPLVENELVYVPPAAEDIVARERNREKALRRVRMPLAVRRIDINIAPRDELATIPGIGDKIAEAIILERVKNPFRSTEEIGRVRGIGPRKYERMKDYITVGTLERHSRYVN